MSTQPVEPPIKPASSSRILYACGALYFVLLGCIIAYIWLVAQDRFLSIASFKISRQSATSSELNFGQIALAGLSDTGSVDSQIAIGFVNSTDLLVDLESQFKLQDHYASPPRDFIFRMHSGDPLEERLEFYRKRIFAHFDKESGLTMLTVDTFDPQLSKEIAETVLKRTESFINDINHAVADQQLIFVKSEVERAENHVKEVTLNMLNLQNKYNIITPEAAISENLRRMQGLRLEQLKLAKNVATLKRDSPDSPLIDKLQSELHSLDELIKEEATRISGPEQDRLNQILAEYKELDLKLEFAIRMRAAAETLLEKHRIEAIARSRFISIIQNPYLPEDVGYPLRGYATISILVLGFLLFTILRVMFQAISEKI